MPMSITKRVGTELELLEMIALIGEISATDITHFTHIKSLVKHGLLRKTKDKKYFRPTRKGYETARISQIEAYCYRMRSEYRIKQNVDFAITYKFGKIHLLCQECYLGYLLKGPKEKRFKLSFDTISTYT